MGKERKCILCQTVYNSNQEMDEHMRSMLHHRELENIKGRDCGHECRVCRVSVVGLTAYAAHISSALHKQRVTERESGGDGPEEDYFDKELVELIEKRKEQIRKEEEAAKQAREEEERRKRQELNARQWVQQGAQWGWGPTNFAPSPRGTGMANWRGVDGRWNPAQGAWHPRGAPPRTWNQGNQEQSSTWQEEVPPNLQTWGRGGWGGKSRNKGFQGFSPKNKGQQQPPPQSGGDGIYSESEFYWEQRAAQFLEGMNSMDFTSNELPQTGAMHFDGRPGGCFGGPSGWERGHQAQRGGYHSREISNGDHGKTNSSKDRLYRWSPYPTAKLGDAPPTASNEEGRGPLAGYGTGPSMQVKDLKLKFDFVLGAMKSQDPTRGSSAPQPQEGTNKKKKKKKQKHHKSGHDDQDGWRDESKPAVPKDPKSGREASSTTRPVPRRKFTRWDCEFPAPTKLFRQPSVEAGGPQSRRGSADTSSAVACLERKAREAESTEDRTGQDWVGRRRNSEGAHHPTFDHNSSGCRRSSYPQDELKKAETSQPAPALSLQSVQVSTSTCDTPERAELSPRPDEDSREARSEKEQAGHATDEGLGSDSDPSRPGPGPGSAQPSSVPALNKLGLPASLKRDLSRHMGPRGKSGIHEPNLNIARRIRNLSGTRKGEAEKDTGLKPTLRQLISSTGSRRNVNWDQVYQEVNRKKQEQEKGMPRFGIEMVNTMPSDPEGLEAEGDLCEGYHWESISESAPTPPGTGPRKRSLSESSVAGDRASSALSLFGPAPLSRDRPEVAPRLASEPRDSPSLVPGAGAANTENAAESGEAIAGLLEEDSSGISEVEQVDAQGSGKKRRAAGEVLSPDIPCSERQNKRMKIKCKKERSQVDQLLAVSLREEELSSSLQAVDSSLIQARAALQAAYMEVQRLLVVKQQVTLEMSTLRSRRIEILQGMQDGYDGTALPLGEKNSPADHAATPTPTSTLLGPPAVPSVLPLLPPVLPNAAPPVSVSPPRPLKIKQEPTSPSRSGSPAENPHSTPPGTAPEHPLAPSLSDPAQPKSSISPPLIGPRRPSVSSLDSGSMCTETRPNHVRVTLFPGLSSFSLSESKGTTSPLRRDSQTGSTDRTELLTETSTGGTFHAAPAEPGAPAPPASPTQNDPKKRVRKLKKKRVLRKSAGAEQAENSDTEQDGDTSSRPVRRIKSKKKGKGPQVSTSTPTGTGAGLGLDQGQEAETREAPPTKAEQGGTESDDSSSLEMVELPQPTLEVVAIDDSSDEERKPAAMETAYTPAAPEAVKEETTNLACDEVSSTSELDSTAKTKACASQTQPPLISVKEPKDNSDISSEPGEEEEPSEGWFEGHQGAVNSMQIHCGQLYTCSGDRTVRAFDLVTRLCVAVFEGHSNKVNCLLVSSSCGLRHRLYTGSSDQTIRCYNLKTREFVELLSLPDRVLCLHSRWKVLYAGLANGNVVSFNLKNNRQLDTFECHGPRAVSCLVSAQEGARRLLLVGSYDCTISVRDAKNGLLLRTLEGHTKTVLCMKVVNDLVFSGSSDQSVQAHNIHTGELVRIYKGHSHAVTVVTILGNVMVTACLDKLVRVYELQSHDRLQVYGGHKDMVMCMAIHKSMIYTGCYDGSVQAVRLNLIQNYRCWWHGCSLIFGVREHLQQHVLTDHASPSFQTLKCRWRNCEAFFTMRNNSQEDVPLHMQTHVEMDSKLEP
ncbi:hypothetical protein GJAV_G00003520 [Gymnothorax javanicus]|nr:hypothetical protein GJAV_G00003520 [Gymnothorax javanicus]